MNGTYVEGEKMLSHLFKSILWGTVLTSEYTNNSIISRGNSEANSGQIQF